VPDTPDLPYVREVTAFDRLSPADAAAVLAPCCASRQWAAAVIAGRPYGTLARLTAASGAAIAALDWAGISEALSAHPRIGDAGAAAPGQEAAWSAREQSAAMAAGDSDRDRLAAGNAAYERRFGHVFLICATGKTAAQILAAQARRMGNDPAAEREVTRAELAAIVALRLARVLREQRTLR
jgi:2-oxo-4-hydroxy-4-carboxy-5-ureidoimidazoline decarboxylase